MFLNQFDKKSSSFNINIIIVVSRDSKLVSKLIKSITKASLNFKVRVGLELIVNKVNYPAGELEKLFIELNCIIQYLSKIVSPAEARNIALRNVRDGYVLFLDDDIELPENYFHDALFILNKYNPCVLGGPDRIPEKSTFLQKIFSMAIESFDVTFHTRSRHVSSSITDKYIVKNVGENSLILCNLWIHSKYFLEQKLTFDNNLWRNEENVLLAKISKIPK